MRFGTQTGRALQRSLTLVNSHVMLFRDSFSSPALQTMVAMAESALSYVLI